MIETAIFNVFFLLAAFGVMAGLVAAIVYGGTPKSWLIFCCIAVVIVSSIICGAVAPSMTQEKRRAHIQYMQDLNDAQVHMDNKRSILN